METLNWDLIHMSVFNSYADSDTSNSNKNTLMRKISSSFLCRYLLAVKCAFGRQRDKNLYEFYWFFNSYAACGNLMHFCEIFMNFYSSFLRKYDEICINKSLLYIHKSIISIPH